MIRRSFLQLCAAIPALFAAPMVVAQGDSQYVYILSYAARRGIILRMAGLPGLKKAMQGDLATLDKFLNSSPYVGIFKDSAPKHTTIDVLVREALNLGGTGCAYIERTPRIDALLREAQAAGSFTRAAA